MPSRPAFILIALTAACLLAAACHPASRREAPPASTSAASAATVPERYVSAAFAGEELDSLATWTSPQGRTWLIASGKSRHRLSVFDADTGQRLRTFGVPGTGPGQFKRPNGLAVSGHLLFVVERDNHRVQVLTLPEFAPAGLFGADLLRSPYGLWLNETGPGALEAYVTDSFMYGKDFDVVPPLTELSQRVRRFRLRVAGDRVQAEAAGSFGDTRQAGALHVVESLAGDPAHDRLLIADEDTLPQSRHSSLRVYTLAGRYTGRSLPEGSFQAHAEGVALWRCSDDSGYWVAVEQVAPLTRFHLFDRKTLQWRATWQGATTAYTDGIALHLAPTPAFPAGALFAVHQDASVAAFDLREVARTLGLAGDCLE